MGTFTPLTEAQTTEAKKPKFTPLLDAAPDSISAPKDLPEITSQTEIPWYDRLGTDAKLLMTNKPWEKARIIAKSFPDRVVLMADEETNQPVISLDGNNYVVNKEGMSTQDLNDFIAETGSYLPAAILSGGTSLLARLGIGAISYGITEAGREAGTFVAGGKAPGEAPIDLADVGTMGAIGGVTEALAPPIVKAGARLLRPLWQRGKKVTGDLIDAAVAAAMNTDRSAVQAARGQRLQEGNDALISAAASGDPNATRQAIQNVAPYSTPEGLPLTRGQATGSPSLLETEGMMREGTGAYGEQATNVMRNADQQQMGAIESQAQNLQGEIGAGSGFSPDALTNIGQRLQSDIIQKEASMGARAGAAQQAAKERMRDDPVYIAGSIFKDGIDSLASTARDRFIGAASRAQMPLLDSSLKTVRSFQKAFERGRITKASYSMIADFRKSLQTKINIAGAHTEEGAALVGMVNKIDGFVDDAVTKGLIEGDPSIISNIKDANRLWSDYKKAFWAGRPDRFKNADMAGNRIQKILGDETPTNVVNYFANISKSAPKEVGQLYKRMEDMFGADSEQIKLIKDAVLYKIFTSANRKGKSDITRTDIVKNYTEFFNKNKPLAEKMFSKFDIEKIRKYVTDVARTMPAEEVINPSGTGKFLARLMRDVGEGGLLARVTSPVPFAGAQSGAGYARVLAYGDRLSSAPWSPAAAAAADKSKEGQINPAVSSAGASLYNNVFGNDERN